MACSSALIVVSASDAATTVRVRDGDTELTTGRSRARRAARRYYVPRVGRDLA